MFSIDTSTFLSTASSIFEALFPAFAVVVGVVFGIGLITRIVGEIRKAI